MLINKIMWFPENEWEEKVLRELIRLTKPGGWLEIMQTDSQFSRCGRNLEKWNNAVVESVRMNGSICEKFESWLLDESKISKLPSFRLELGLARLENFVPHIFATFHSK